MVLQKPIHPLRVAVCRSTIAVNGGIYRTMKTNFFVPVLNSIDVNDVWFQLASIDVLRQVFDNVGLFPVGLKRPRYVTIHSEKFTKICPIESGSLKIVFHF